MGVFDRLKGSGGGSSGASSYGVFKRLKLDDDIESERLERQEKARRDVQQNSITQVTQPNVQQPVIRRGNRTTNERANVNPAVIGVKKPADNQPSWGKTIGSSLLGGVAQTQASMFNVPRKVIEGVSIGLDKVLPDSIYNREMQENDPIKRTLDKAVESNEERAIQYQKDLEDAKGLKNFVATGLSAVPQIVMAGFGGAAA